MKGEIKEYSKKSIYLTIGSILICIFFLFPLYWMLVSSLKTDTEIFKNATAIFPSKLYFGAYLNQFHTNNSLIKGFVNSTIISLGTTFLSTILVVPAAYGLATFKFVGRKIIILLFLISQMLPPSLILTPLFVIFYRLGLLDNYLAPIIAVSTNAVPFAILILRTYFLSIPRELTEAARIDGCNTFTAFVRIMIPIAYPGIIVGAVFSFLFAWGDLMYSLTFLRNENMQPMTLGIYNFIGKYGMQWNSILAFGTITVLPVVLIFIFLQKYIVSGMTSGAVKE
ncbi:carbohydrate ABC transporter permease [Thermoanaerobacterium thermosaccharolyticum]|jgi:multiple sugar transport system permease protein|uniref:carbohydrate ABC transporter permease n=1 Tax=Thermoanaerobacterium thermosaccharolyticum TaxID=1517 RepID=UPI003D2A63FD